MTVKQALQNRTKTYYGIYYDVGIILDNYTLDELFAFVKENYNMNTALRYDLEQAIINHEREANYERRLNT